MSKLAAQYYDAIVSGNKEEARRIKIELEKTAAPKVAVSVHANSIIGDDKSSAIKIYNFLNDKLGEDWWNWEIETIEKMLWVNYGVALTDVIAEKIQAIKVVMNNQRVFLDWWYFNQVANSLNGSPATFTTIVSPSPGMAISTMRTLKALRPEQDFSRDVKKYVSIILKDNGIYAPPPSIPYIIEEFETMVDKTKWPIILKRAAEIMDKEEVEDNDVMEDIQAKRLLVAEKAADVFGGNN